MSRLFPRALCGGALAIASVMPGCSAPDATSSMASGLVKGKVTFGGKPLTKAELTFNPSNVNRKNVPSVTSLIKDDGTYEVTTLIGQNQISLSGPGVAKVPQLSYFAKSIEVKPGENELDIALP